jgi:UDP-hydrolysing UDP-N-acetyl-D-glucosamine 2-epimerase
MSKKRTICVVITARPSYARIRTAMEAMRDHPDIDLKVVVSATMVLERFGTASNIVEADGFEVEHKIFCMLEGGTLLTNAKSTGLSVVELSSVFDEMRPDAILTIADRFETLATAIAASYLNIPLIHVQGGEISGNIDNKVRNAVTKLADLHLVSSEPAAKRVIGMGEEEGRVFVTGCPSIDIAAQVAKDPELRSDFIDHYRGVGHVFDLPEKGFFVVLQHPVTTETESALDQVNVTLNAVAEVGVPTVWFWPNVDAGTDSVSKGIRAFRDNVDPENIHFFKNVTPDDFLRLVNRSAGIIGNSSVGIRECAYLGVPAINLGNRQQNRDRGANCIDLPHDKEKIKAEMRRLLSDGRPKSDHLYGEGDAGEKIADILATHPLTLKI